MSRVFFTDRDLGKQFPARLREAGLQVERHADHFQPATPDEVWLPEVGRRGWVVLTHDERIRYKPVSVRPTHLDGRNGYGYDDQPAGVQRCGSSSSIRLAGWVGSRSSTSLR